MLTANWRVAASVGALGMIIPFGLGELPLYIDDVLDQSHGADACFCLGAGTAYGLYHQFRNDDGVGNISFGI